MHRPYLSLENQRRPTSPVVKHRHQIPSPSPDRRGRTSASSATVLQHLRRDLSQSPERRPFLVVRSLSPAVPNHSIFSSLSSLEDQAKAWLAGDRSQIPPNLSSLLAHTSQRLAIVQALSACLPGSASVLVSQIAEVLLKFMRDRDVFMRSEVMKALGNVVAVGIPAHVMPRLVKALTSPDVTSLLRSPVLTVRRAAVEVLGQMTTCLSDSDYVAVAGINFLALRAHCFLLNDEDLGLRCYFIKLLAKLILSSNNRLVAAKAVDMILRPESRLLLDDLEEQARAAMIEALANIVSHRFGVQRETAAEYLVNADLLSLLAFREGPAGGVLVGALKQITKHSDDLLAQRARKILTANSPWDVWQEDI